MVFNPLFDEYAALLVEVELPLQVSCHLPKDAEYFAENSSFDHTTKGFGWASSSVTYTSGQRLTAPTGLDALLLYYLTEGEARGAPPARGVDLLVFAMGRIVDRVEIARYVRSERNALAPGVAADGLDHGPGGAATRQYDIIVSDIERDGLIRTHRIMNQSGRQLEERTAHEHLLRRPRHRALHRVTHEEAGVTYSFTDHEIAQIEGAIAEHGGVIQFALADVVDAARYKYGHLSEGAWQLIAGTLGLPVDEAKALQAQRDDWWTAYAAMHDGENPYA